MSLQNNENISGHGKNEEIILEFLNNKKTFIQDIINKIFEDNYEKKLYKKENIASIEKYRNIDFVLNIIFHILLDNIEAPNDLNLQKAFREIESKFILEIVAQNYAMQVRSLLDECGKNKKEQKEILTNTYNEAKTQTRNDQKNYKTLCTRDEITKELFIDKILRKKLISKKKSHKTYISLLEKGSESPLIDIVKAASQSNKIQKFHILLLERKGILDFLINQYKNIQYSQYQLDDVYTKYSNRFIGDSSVLAKKVLATSGFLINCETHLEVILSKTLNSLLKEIKQKVISIEKEKNRTNVISVNFSN